MNSDKKEQLPASFTRLQTRRLRPSTTRDRNAWQKLVCTSPARYTDHVQPKASTSMVRIDEDDDGLQMRAPKRTCHRSEASPKFAIPRDESIDEAMSGFQFLHIDKIQALQDKSNFLRERNPVRACSAAKNTRTDTLSTVKTVGWIGTSSTPLILTSTPPQGQTNIVEGFAALEAADLSIIAPVPTGQFRFSAKSQNDNPPPSSPPTFEFRGCDDSLKRKDASLLSLNAGPSEPHSRKLTAPVVRTPAGISSTSLQDGVIANLLQNQLALDDSTPASLPYNGPESQQTATTEGNLASGSEVDVLQPFQGRKRKVSKVRLTSGKTSYTSLKAKKRSTRETSRSSLEGFPVGIKRKGKSVPPSNVQMAKGVLTGMRGTKGSLIRDTPAKAGPETSVDELGLA